MEPVDRPASITITTRQIDLICVHLQISAEKLMVTITAASRAPTAASAAHGE